MKIYTLLGICLLIFSGCTDPYKLQTNTFDEALVVEATITNEMKHQEIKISRTYRLEQDGPVGISDASVFVTDDAGNNYEFNEENGIYLSDMSFQAAPDREYTLNITTADGRSYSSTSEKLTTVTPLTSVTASVETINGEKGIQIQANSYDPTNTSKYYRYRYDETFKVVSPKWSSSYAVISVDLFPGWDAQDYIQLHPRTYEAQTCYVTKPSEKIIVATTTNLSEDRIQNFPIQFIAAQDYKIAHRYSINLFQYVQSPEAYSFYKMMAQIGGEGGNILSPNQPGFVTGNIRSNSDPEEQVIGFFDVSSVSQQRIFLNFSDLFPTDLPTPFSMDCTAVSLNANDFSRDSNEGGILRDNIVNGSLLYYSHIGSIYTMVSKECGDCTTFASNVVPSFWIE